MITEKKRRECFVATSLLLLLSVIGCTSSPNQKKEESKEKTKIKIAWWGGSERQETTKQILDLYEKEHEEISFEVLSTDWDGYFDKLAIQAASGEMPDIVQMDYMYITTYTQNRSLTDLSSYIEKGIIDVSQIDETLLATGKVDEKITGIPLSVNIMATGCNPSLFKEAGLLLPEGEWTWEEFRKMTKQIYDKTGKWGAVISPVEDVNILQCWVRQHGQELFRADYQGLDCQNETLSDYLDFFHELMGSGALPGPDEYAKIQTLGQERGPMVTKNAAMILEWNNYAVKVEAYNDEICMFPMPVLKKQGKSGLWQKPGMFFSISDTSEVKKECAEFINWFINSKEANEIMHGERGVPASLEIREYLLNSGKLSHQQQEMYAYINQQESVCGKTPPPDPRGLGEINDVFKDTAYEVFYGQSSSIDAVKKFRAKAEKILKENN